MDKLELYLERRVKTLLAEGWEHWRIVQQLEAWSGRKKVEQLIQRFSQ